MFSNLNNIALLILFLFWEGALSKLWRMTYITLKFLYKKENWSILNLLLMVCHNNVIQFLLPHYLPIQVDDFFWEV